MNCKFVIVFAMLVLIAQLGLAQPGYGYGGGYGYNNGGYGYQQEGYECGRACGSHVDRCRIPCQGGLFKFRCIMCIGVFWDDCTHCFVRHEQSSMNGGGYSLFGSIPSSGLMGIGGLRPGFGGIGGR